VTFGNGLLTYTPATNQFLGTNAEMVTSELIVADTFGRRATNWQWERPSPALLDRMPERPL